MLMSITVESFIYRRLRALSLGLSIGARLRTSVAALLVAASPATLAQSDDFDVSAPPKVTATKAYELPATSETSNVSPQTTNSSDAKARSSAEAGTTTSTDVAQPTSGADSLFGKAKITELKRENGQTYSIEIQHSQGAKQYIEDSDADGLTDGKTKDIDETPNIAKWRIGSW